MTIDNAKYTVPEPHEHVQIDNLLCKLSDVEWVLNRENSMRIKLKSHQNSFLIQFDSPEKQKCTYSYLCFRLAGAINDWEEE